MNIRDYFAARNFRKPKHAEIVVFSLPQPLPVGWISMDGTAEVTPAMLHRIKTFHLSNVVPAPIGQKVRQVKEKTPKKKKSQHTQPVAQKAQAKAKIPAATHTVEGVDVRSTEFLRTWAWRELRYATIKRYGPVCQCCGATAKTSGEPIQVDHIKPRSLFPELAMDPENLQVLCAPCNQGKSNTDFTDWRPSHPAQP